MSKADELAKRWLRMADYAYQCRDDLRDSGGNTPRSHELRLLGEDMAAELRRHSAVEAERDALRAALQETWRVMDAAGLIHLSNGVQLGPTAWYVKACDAREMSLNALNQKAPS